MSREELPKTRLEVEGSSVLRLLLF